MNLDQGFLGSIYKLLYPLEWLMTQVMVFFQKFFVMLGMQDGSGFAWVLSIVFLTITVRVIILPFFVKQMASMGRMQAIQPQLKKIQNKYKGKNDSASREAMSRTQTVAQHIMDTELFGTKISHNFTNATGSGKIVIGLFVAYMCITMFLSQYYSLRRNMPKESFGTSQYNTQRMMAFIFPVMYIFSGIAFPFAVLIYWATNNTWTLIQMIFQIENFPTPGSAAYETKQKREEKRRERLGLPTVEEEELQKVKEAQEKLKKNGGNQRYQPSRKKKK